MPLKSLDALNTKIDDGHVDHAPEDELPLEGVPLADAAVAGYSEVGEEPAASPSLIVVNENEPLHEASDEALSQESDDEID